MAISSVESSSFKSGYADVNGIRMYYEIHGEGEPLVLIHGGGSTIQTTFGRVLPLLARHRQVIGVELQAHGRTGDRETALSFEQDADDVAVLLRQLGISKADFLGFSNGGNTAMQIALRYPAIVGKLIVGSAFYKRSGIYDQVWEFIRQGTIQQMPQEYKDAYREVAPDPGHLQVMHDKCARRVLSFSDWSEEQMRSIKAPTLIVAGDADVVKPEHVVEMYRLIPNCRLLIVPGGHGEYLGEITALKPGAEESDFIIPEIESFLGGVR